MKNYSFFSACVFLSCLVLSTSCSKKDNDDSSSAPVQAAVSVAGISPSSGPYSTIVTITGSGFHTTAAVNKVRFNGKEALVTSATATQLVVVVPEAAGTGPVNVQWGSKTGTGPVFNFTYTITVSTIAGTGAAGLVNGSSGSAQFKAPHGIAIDANQNIFVSEYGNHVIRKINSSGSVSTFAGTGVMGFADGNGAVARFKGPNTMDIDASGNLYVTDRDNHRVRKITPSAVVSTLAGSTLGYADGNGSSAQFAFPTGIDVDENGNVYVGDMNNYKVRKITPAGVVSTLAGSTAGYSDASALSAQFKSPGDILFISPDTYYITDDYNHCIRMLNNGMVTTYAGSSTEGNADGNGTSAQFEHPLCMVMDADGNIYLSDFTAHRIRKISPAGDVSTVAGSVQGFEDGNGSNAKFHQPAGMAIDANGYLIVADYGNNRIRKVMIQ